MSFSSKNGIYLFSVLIMSGMTLSASAAEPAATPVVVPAPAAPPVADSAPAATPVVVPAPAATPVVVPAPAATPVVVPAPAATPVVVPAPAATPVVVPAPAATPVVVPAPAAPPVADSAPAATPVVVPAPAAPPVADSAPAAPPVADSAPAATPVVVPAPAATPVVAPATVPVFTPELTPDTSTITKAPAAETMLPTAEAETTLPALATKVIPEEVTADSIQAAGVAAAPAHMLDSEEQKRAYASGVMLAHFFEEQLDNQKSLHITLNKNILLAGIADTFAHQVKMSDEEIKATMFALDEQVKVLTQVQNEKKQAQDKAYVDAFAKREGVKKTKQGLLYLIDHKGDGAALKDTDTVQVYYKGTLVDGTIVDGPKVNNATEFFRVANMPPVLRDSVKRIRKGGQITVVIPPATLKKNKDANGESPLNTVVIYNISVVDVNQLQ
ncbi:FKBP-type peptidyl-prolyl cis-trans isomerase N-terminal domain-containing protein [Enterobacter bugandensis]|uniref:FKBP-type peptidyl-prolyl cis-trans isomerase N-terminal domain-containing protein n=1 Tax=Enterobacter bugandensis TaxID=881260 RepID=UPI0020054BE1|nr:FKBP-type peptidyl-prolyl cis-trans isomerase N-terminal domain-containing protein [Enterobacter bugandensis]MCK6964560.1 FKBP-type peptidyl-prolyl cis-trans isomerase [Enterobacter bugandensis]